MSRVLWLSIFLTLLTIAGCAATDEAGTTDDVARTWSGAQRCVPTGASPPVVVFLHGCTGITAGSQTWCRVLRDAGFLVVMPDSFARRGRTADCDPRSNTGQRDPSTLLKRTEEAEFAVAQVRKLNPPKVFLMGHSEGALATQYWMGIGGYDGAIISGTACARINLPSRLPTLIVRYEADPWDPYPPLCAVWAAQRENTKLWLLPGTGHDPADHPDAQRQVVDFLRRH